MPSKVFKRGATTPEMNLTPLIDVVFQLIIFFMLVNNFVSNELAAMIVPDVHDPQTQKLAEENRVVVNILPVGENPGADRVSPHWSYEGDTAGVQIGMPDPNEPIAISNTQAITAAIEEARGENENTTVILRADAATYFKHVQTVTNAIRAAGVERVNLVAYMPGESPTGADTVQARTGQ